MKKTLFALTTALSLLFVTAAFSEPGGGQSGFVNDWHGTGSDHQANNNPGDTATDRHNFDANTAGKSDKNPASNSPKN